MRYVTKFTTHLEIDHHCITLLENGLVWKIAAEHTPPAFPAATAFTVLRRARFAVLPAILVLVIFLLPFLLALALRILRLPPFFSPLLPPPLPPLSCGAAPPEKRQS